jgi:hypothetical protein
MTTSTTDLRQRDDLVQRHKATLDALSTPPAAPLERLPELETYIESALRWHEVFEDGRGPNNLTLVETRDMLCRRFRANFEKETSPPVAETKPVRQSDAGREALQAFIKAYGSQDSFTDGLDKAYALAKAALPKGEK